MSMAGTVGTGGMLPTALERWSMRVIGGLVANVYFRLKRHGEVHPGPTLYVGLHRNGAVDGWVHSAAFGARTIFFVGANLRKNLLTRPFAIGIPLERAKDGGNTAGNRSALSASLTWLRSGNALFIYPEGTSTLGPKTLSMHRGAAALAVEALQAGIALKVIPVGIDYAAPATPGSQVDVMTGAEIDLAGLPEDRTKAVECLHERITGALLGLAFPFPDEASQDRARRIALCCAKGNRAARLYLLRKFSDSEGPPQATNCARQSAGRSMASLFLMLPGLLINAPLAFASWLSAKVAADGPNVVALYRILSGLFLGPAWLVLTGFCATALFGSSGLLVPLAQILLGVIALRYAHDATALFESRASRCL